MSPEPDQKQPPDEGKGKGKGRMAQQRQHRDTHSEKPKTKPKQTFNRYSTLPDLRFLNHNNPPPTAFSLLDLTSVNSAHVQQFQALREAEAWYAGTATLLQERLVLCERLRDGLSEVNKLLVAIESGIGDGMVSGRVDDKQGQEVGIEAGGDDAVESAAGARFDMQVGHEDGLEISPAVDAAQDQMPASGLVMGDNEQSRAKDDAASSAVATSTASGSAVTTSEDNRIMAEAIEEWLKDIRVSRAKWIAGGRDMEKRVGLR